MSASALSLHLVDRIVGFEPARRAVGRLAIPSEASELPPCLVVEAIGQLAAWVAMAHSDFAKRPVATHAGEVRLLGEALPGRELELEVRMRSCKSVAVAYAGEARVGGERLVELDGAVGTMLPMAEFEDPDEARARFSLLLGAGLPARRFPSREGFAPRVLSIDIDPGKRAVAEVEVAPPGELYADHFPRRPVYPATLLLDAQLRVAMDLVAATSPAPGGRRLEVRRVRAVKVRSFTPPGGRVTIVAEPTDAVRSTGDEATEIAITASTDGTRVSSAILSIVAKR